jgi:hypothetical protein
VERKLKMHHDSLEKLKLDFSKGEHEISDLQAQLFALDLACKEFKGVFGVFFVLFFISFA